jgi:transcription elongation GreA/GreB family factor
MTGWVSKAFTSEETEDAPVLGRLVQRAAAGDERPITSEGYAALVSRQRTLASEHEAAMRTGDRDGIAEAAHRLALVTATLESVRVVERAPPDGTVRFGSEVSLAWEDGRAQRVTLVGPDEAEGSARISVSSPLGRALVGAKVGAEIEIERPRGAAIATIVRVA